MDILMSQTDLGKNVYPGKIELDGSRIDFSGEGLIIRNRGGAQGNCCLPSWM